MRGGAGASAVPVRQGVLTLPFALRYRLAFDAELTAAVLREILRAAFAALRRRARRACCAAVVFVAILECLGLPARPPPVAPARRTAAAARLFEPASGVVPRLRPCVAPGTVR